MGVLGGAADSLAAGLASLSQGGELGACDGIRAMSVLWVLADHGFAYSVKPKFPALQHHWASMLPIAGNLGVDAFFVLSGFLLGGALHGEQLRTGTMALGKFMCRRVFRIYPTLYSAMVAAAIANRFAYPGPDGALDFRNICPDAIWWYNLYFWNNMGDTRATCNDQTWTVAVELQMYAATPVLLALSSRLAAMATFGCPHAGCRGRVTTSRCAASLCLMAWAACVALRLRYVFSSDSDDASFNRYYIGTQYNFGAYAVGVLAGVLVAQWKAQDRLCAFRAHGSCAALVLACLAFASCIVVGREGPSIWPVLWVRLPILTKVWVALSRMLFAGAVAWVVVQCACGPETALARFLGAPAWRPVAALSYSMYMMQFASYDVFSHPLQWTGIGRLCASLHSGTPVWQVALVGWLVVLAFVLVNAPLSFLNYICIERPGIALGKWCVRRWCSGPTAARFVNEDGAAKTNGPSGFAPGRGASEVGAAEGVAGGAEGCQEV